MTKPPPPKKPPATPTEPPAAPEPLDDVTITLRIGAALRKAIYDAAAADKRSMNSTITLACEEWLAAKGYWTLKEPPKKPTPETLLDRIRKGKTK